LESHFHLQFSIAPVCIGLAGIVFAYRLYQKENAKSDTIANSLGGLYKSAYHKFYIDEIYLFITQKILFNIIGKTAAWFDKTVVNGAINLTGTTTQTIAEGIKKVQSGKVQQYALYFLAGLIALSVLFIYVWK
jgi:NADH-quinone oxidoreductase subunit L